MRSCQSHENTSSPLRGYRRTEDRYTSSNRYKNLSLGLKMLSRRIFLLLDSKILHCNISVNNILLTKFKDDEEFGGLLIDLGLVTSFYEGE
ncbi:Bgt-50892 [Blumeria graminis f. sp. tritici]|uniref:Bgt-50892 n=1 Tax=Blumeria graminis f. sp. tritici TaxID=62690 RepID=A0A9X9QEB6_BLUGR|nr:Bgt-50892 [Blumeria graminis f. sp. tritici]